MYLLILFSTLLQYFYRCINLYISVYLVHLPQAISMRLVKFAG
jgi:hypothetical protein